MNRLPVSSHSLAVFRSLNRTTTGFGGLIVFGIVVMSFGVAESPPCEEVKAGCNDGSFRRGMSNFCRDEEPLLEGRAACWNVVLS